MEREIKVCIGSACYIKGSDDVIEAFSRLINEHSLQSKVTLSASFCLERCTDAVSVMRWDGFVFSASKNNAREKFEEHIMSYL